MKKFALGFILLLVLCSMIVSLSEIGIVKASGTIYIRADGTVEGTTHIVTIDNVTYTFTSNIYDEIVVERDDVVVDGASYTLQGTGVWASKGISLTGRSNVTIKNIEIKSFHYGIHLAYSSNNTISGNNITNNDFGVCLDYSLDNTVSGNNITNNDTGMWLKHSSDSSIIGNDVMNNQLEGIRLTDSTNNIIDTNLVLNNGHGISLKRSDNNIVDNNPIVNNTQGIILDSSHNNTLSGQHVSINKQYGIYLCDSSNNTISGNNITNSPDSDLAIHIWLINSSNNNIYDNNIEKGYNGIYLSNSSYNNIYSNTITEITGVGGIILSKSSYNNIYANTLTNGNGISLITSSNNLIIQNNLNLTCDWLCWINLTGPPVCGGRVMLYCSSNNVIYHNNFVMNRNLLYINDSVNIWDDGYPSGGNYWSDYIAKANDTYSGPFQNETGSSFPKYTSDGIGDTEYIIDANNTDNYPLMGMFSDFKATSEYHVQTICSSTVVDFQYNGTAISFNVIGGNETVGFCRICVPTGLMNDTYTVIVRCTWRTSPVIYILLPCSNSTHSYLYFGLNPSDQKVIIIPEFPSWTSMLLILVVLTVAIVTYKRRLSGT